MPDLSEAGFKERTRVSAARERLLDVPPIDRTERISLSAADGRTVAEPIDAVANVPHYARAAMDGWAVRAEDTFGASDRSPAIVNAGSPGERWRIENTSVATPMRTGMSNNNRLSTNRLGNMRGSAAYDSETRFRYGPLIAAIWKPLTRSATPRSSSA